MALGEKLADEKGRTTIKLSYASIPDDGSDDEDDEEDEEKQPAVNLVSTVITSLTPGKVRIIFAVYICGVDISLCTD